MQWDKCDCVLTWKGASMRSEAATLAPTKAAVTSLGRQEVLSNHVFMVDVIALRACTAHIAEQGCLAQHICHHSCLRPSSISMRHRLCY